MVKINQLFLKRIDEDLMLALMKCFGLAGFDDRRIFCKMDMANMHTTEKFIEILDRLKTFYIPCKAIMFLDHVSEKKAITVLRQCLRTYDYVLKSVERNHKNKKNIFYSIISKQESDAKECVKITQVERVISF